MEQIRSLQIVAATFLISLVSCTDPAVTSSPATATAGSAGRTVGTHPVVTFPDVRNETEGIAAEHAWTQTHHPGYQWSSRQILEDTHGHIYHRVLLVNRRGQRVTVYFDVTRWFDQL